MLKELLQTCMHARQLARAAADPHTMVDAVDNIIAAIGQAGLATRMLDEPKLGLWLVAYRDDDGPYAVAFSSQDKAEAYAKGLGDDADAVVTYQTADFFEPADIEPIANFRRQI